MPSFVLVRVNFHALNPYDTHAAPISARALVEPVELEATIHELLETTVLPDPADRLETAIVDAADAGAARLARRARWTPYTGRRP